jgi:VWFA-related protein
MSGALLWAQVESPPEIVFRTDARLVLLHATVMHPQSGLLTTLPESAFRVSEDGVDQEIAVFRREDAPISLGLLVDRSPSMTHKREKVVSAALALIRASNPDDEVFVMNFDENTYLDQDFTSDIGKLERGLRNFESRGGTAMRDALRLAVEHLANRARKEKKVVLVISDGEDNSSIQKLEHLVKVSLQEEVLIYAVGFLAEETPDAARRARRDLDSLSKSTGGRAWYPKTVAEMEQIALDIAHELRNQYVIGYHPKNTLADGGFRRIRLAVDVPGAVARTRGGYYATPHAD